MYSGCRNNTGGVDLEISLGGVDLGFPRGCSGGWKNVSAHAHSRGGWVCLRSKGSGESGGSDRGGSGESGGVGRVWGDRRCRGGVGGVRFGVDEVGEGPGGPEGVGEVGI